ncbi:hypothetical protein Tco_0550783 [Tanacetum coccineum]
MTTNAQQIALDNALVAPENRRVIGKCNMRINLGMKPKEPTYQVVLDALALTICYPSFLITAEVPEDLDYQTDNKDSKKQDKMFYLRFMKIFIHHFLKKDKSILMRNKTFTHTARDDSLLVTMRFVSRHEDTQVYGAILPEAMTNQAMLDSVSPSKKKSTSKPQHSKKKAPVKATRGKGLNVLSEVALSEVAQLKEATKRSKKGFHISQASGSGTNEGTGTKPGVPDVPKYDSESDKDSWGNSDEEEDDDKEDTNDGDDDDDDMNDDDDDETDSERTKSDKIKIPDLNKSSSKEHDDEEEEYEDEFNVEEEENMDEEENDDVIKELYKDANLNLGNKDADMTEAEQGGADQHNVSHGSGFEQEEEDAHVTLTTVHDTTEGPMQSYSVSSDFTSKLLNLENPSSDVNEITSLMNTTTIPPPPPLINPLQPQVTSTPTPTASETTTLFIALPDFSFVFKFNDRVTKLETDLLKMKQVDQYAQAISSIPSIVDRYIENKLKEVKPERPPTPDPDWDKRQRVDFRPPQTWISDSARAEKPPTSFDELMDTPIDFSAFVMNQLKIPNLTQEIMVGPAFNLLKDTCKSLTELEYHFEEYCRGRQVIPYDYFNNNDLEYLKGGSVSRQYSTFITKTKAATYELNWIEGMVPNIWSPVKVVYDKHAYWGTSHWGVKRQRFYGFANNRTSTKDVYSKKRIIAVTRLTIMKWYDYGHLDEIEVHREDQQLYTFKEEERYDLNVVLRMFTRRIVIQMWVEDLQLGVESYQKKLNLTKPDTFRFEKRRARVMIQNIDKQLFERRLMRNLEKFVGGREYGTDLRPLEQTI